ncbi:hypothetical protein DLAC_10247 [Tieghemostelium lacteum]|uniref:Uncharacterized protein n=1 Tax=Tieghemostelium lacteum TaxID=361077 RepID=A0A151Z510_TIELA|nr:hypothetical protein DLAC_10247 [Tieghemostelium lacteum]|eukprot:KYQ89025.1 hypothetical protein DLAC_10247 [Tieghemostelium lacteum]
MEETNRGKNINQLRNLLQENNKILISGISGIGKTDLIIEYKNKYNNEYQESIRLSELHYQFDLRQSILNNRDNTSLYMIDILRNIDNWIVALDFASAELTDQDIWRCIRENIPLDTLKKTQHLIVVRNKPNVEEYKEFSHLEMKPVTQDNWLLDIFKDFNKDILQSDCLLLNENIAKGVPNLIKLVSFFLKHSTSITNANDLIEQFKKSEKPAQDTMLDLIYKELENTEAFSKHMFHHVAWFYNTIVNFSFIKSIAKIWKIPSRELTKTLQLMENFGLLSISVENSQNYVFKHAFLTYYRNHDYLPKVIVSVLDLLPIDPVYSPVVFYIFSMYLEAKDITLEKDSHLYFITKTMVADIFFKTMILDSTSNFMKVCTDLESIKNYRDEYPHLKQWYDLVLGNYLRVGERFQESNEIFLEYTESLKDFKDKSKQAFEYMFVNHNVGLNYRSMGNLKKAIQYQEVACKTYFQLFKTFYNTFCEELALTYFLLGDMHNSLKYFNKCSGMEIPKSYITLAKVYFTLKRTKEAEKTIEEFSIKSQKSNLKSHSKLIEEYNNYCMEISNKSIVLQSSKYIIVSSTLVVGLGYLLFKYLKK